MPLIHDWDSVLSESDAEAYVNEALNSGWEPDNDDKDLELQFLAQDAEVEEWENSLM